VMVTGNATKVRNYVFLLVANMLVAVAGLGPAWLYLQDWRGLLAALNNMPGKAWMAIVFTLKRVKFLQER